MPGNRPIVGVPPSSTPSTDQAPRACRAPSISGRSVSLRLVEVADAPFIVRLRSGPRGARLSPIGTDLRPQEEWIRAYEERAARGEELYFVIRHRDAGDVGTLRVHDLAHDSFWWGSWIVQEGAPTHTAFESMFLVYELTFFAMDLRYARFAVRRDNPKAAAFHRRFGATTCGEDETRVFLELARERYAVMRPRLERRFAVAAEGGSPAVEKQAEGLPSGGTQGP